MNLTKTQLYRNLRALQAEVEVLRKVANYDALTGLGNRRLLEERTHARGGAFVAIDLDGFKRAQDAHPDGHAYGDRVLRAFARFLLKVVEDTDRVAVRMGGDEFVVWCPTFEAALTIRACVNDWELDGVTASAGVGRDLAEADRGMYAAKRELVAC